MAIDYLLVLVIGICAWSLVREGLWGASLIFFECVFAGLLAMNFFEPVAGIVGRIGFLSSYADIISMCVLFAVTITVLREIDIRMCPELVRFPNWLHRAGGLAFGIMTGWVVAGFLLCAFQTVPLQPSLGLGYSIEEKSLFGGGIDRQWLAFVHRTTGQIFDRSPSRPFDPNASFIDRYYAIREAGGGATEAVVPQGDDAGGAGTSRSF